MVLHTNVPIGPKKLLVNEVESPLGEKGIYQIVKLYENEFLPMFEFTSDIQQASDRINYLNSRAWKAVYMVRKLSD